MATRARLKQNIVTYKEMRPFCENPVCPDPVWNPVTRGSSRDPSAARGAPKGSFIDIVDYIDYIILYYVRLVYYMYVCIYIYIYIYIHIMLCYIIVSYVWPQRRAPEAAGRRRLRHGQAQGPRVSCPRTQARLGE